MFRSRKNLQREDRESGLAFSWRFPMSTTGSSFAAFVLVSLCALAISAGISVRAGVRPPADEPRAVMVLTPQTAWVAALERRAVEEGPFPARWNPAADPAYVGQRSRALRQAHESGLCYEPEVKPVSFARGVKDLAWDPKMGVLPPVPEVALDGPEDDVSREVGLALRPLRSDQAVRVVHASLFLPAVGTERMMGVRFLLEYDADGRVQEATRLDSGEPDASLDEWVARALVDGHGDRPGMLVVESVIER